MWTCHGTNLAFPVNKYDIEITQPYSYIIANMSHFDKVRLK